MRKPMNDHVTTATTTMTNPSKLSVVDRGRDARPRNSAGASYPSNSTARSLSRASSIFSDSSDSCGRGTKRRRSPSHAPRDSDQTVAYNDTQGNSFTLPGAGNANAFGLLSMDAHGQPASPQHSTPRQTPSALPMLPPPASQPWDEIENAYNLGEDFRALVEARFRRGYRSPKAGGDEGSVAYQFVIRMFDTLADAVTPYLEDLGTKAEDIDGDIRGIVRATEIFLHKAKGWQKLRANPGFVMDTDEPSYPDLRPSSVPEPSLNEKIDLLFRSLGNLGNQVQGTIRGLEAKVDKAVSGVHNLSSRVGQLEKPQTAAKGREGDPSQFAASSNPAPTQSKGSASQHVSAAVAPTMAQIVAAAPNPPPKSQANTDKKSAETAKNSNARPKNVRFVFRFEGGGLPPGQRLRSWTIKDRITSVLRQYDCFNRTVLLMAVWNMYGNLIVEFSPGTNPQHILQSGDAFKESLKFPVPCTFSRATNWSKVMLSHVCTGYLSAVGDRAVFSPETLLDEFKHSNPDFADLVFMQQPSWVKVPSTITTEKLSISFAFEDADGSRLNKLLKAPLFMFANRVQARRWNSKPLLRCCLKCHDYEHDGNRCNKKAHCLHCGGAHPTESHRAKCSLCHPKPGQGIPTPTDDPCPHPKRCRACDPKDGLEGHAFNDPTCPKKAQYRVPAFNTLLSASERDQDMTNE